MIDKATYRRIYQDGHREGIRAALPVEPPDWFWHWWLRHGAHAEGKNAWAEFRAHLLGEDA